MALTRLWVGLDVGADTTAVCCTDDTGVVSFEVSIATNIVALDPLLRTHKRRLKLIALEAGPYGVRLAHSLRKLGYRVAIFENLQASKFLAIRQNKTDKNDARGLAELARLGRPCVSEVTLRTPECQRLRSALVTRKRLINVRLALEGTMRSLFRLNGGSLPRSTSAAVLKRNVSAELIRLKRCQRIDLAKDVEPLLSLSEATRIFIQDLDSRLKAVAEENPVCRRFLEIPGVGPICALSFYTSVGDPTRFRRNADIGAYLGMVPVIRQSGQSSARLRISKRGSTMTRTYLTRAALMHLRYGNSALSAWGNRLRERVGGKRTQIAVGRKLAVIMMAMWKRGASYDPKYGNSSARIDQIAESAQ